MQPKYVTISIPRDLVSRIQKLITSGRYGYSSITEFIKDCIRRRLEQLGFLLWQLGSLLWILSLGMDFLFSMFRITHSIHFQNEVIG